MQDGDDAKKFGRLAESCGVVVKDIKGTDVKNVDVEQDAIEMLAGANFV